MQTVEQNMAEITSNNTILQTRMKNLEKLQIFISDSFETVEQNMAEITSKTTQLQTRTQDIETDLQQNLQTKINEFKIEIKADLQTSTTQTHNHIKSLEQQTKKICTKIIADAKTEDRILDQKITETINNNTNLERRMKNLEQNQNKTMTAKKDMVDSSTTTGTQNFKEECTSKLHGSTQKKGGGGYWGSTQPSDTHFKPQKAKKKGGGGYWGD